MNALSLFLLSWWSLSPLVTTQDSSSTGDGGGGGGDNNAAPDMAGYAAQVWADFGSAGQAGVVIGMFVVLVAIIFCCLGLCMSQVQFWRECCRTRGWTKLPPEATT